MYLNDDEKLSFVLTNVNSQYLSWLGEFIGLLKREMNLQYADNSLRQSDAYTYASKLDHPPLVQIIVLAPVRRQAIIWTNTDILWIRS